MYMACKSENHKIRNIKCLCSLGLLATLVTCLSLEISAQTPADHTVIPLDGYLNARGFAANENLTGSGFDGGGYAYPLESLPSQLKAASEGLIVEGIPFQIPPPDGVGNDHVALRGQIIDIPEGTYAGLALLGAAAPEPMVNVLSWIFADEKEEGIRFGLSDWCKSSEFNEKEGIAFSDRWDIQKKTRDPIPCRMWLQVVPCPKEKVVKAIRFGNQPNMHVFAATLLGNLPWLASPLVTNLDEPADCGVVDRDEPIVGYITHYPAVKVGMDELDDAGVTGIVGYIGASSVAQPDLKQLTFTEKKLVSEAICFAGTSNVPITWIINCAPVHAPPWLREKVREEGDAMRFAWGEGSPWGVWPSFFSPTYLHVTHDYLRAMAGYVRDRDPHHNIRAYLAGAEWFYPGLTDYSPRAAEEFRRWAVQQHRGLEGLNQAWEVDYGSVEEIELPEVYVHFPDDREATFSVDEDWCDSSWRVLPYLEVTPGEEYEFSAELMTEDVGPQGAQLQLAWFDGEDKLLHCDAGPLLTGTVYWTKTRVKARAPSGAVKVSPHFKIYASGTARMDLPTFIRLPDGPNLIRDCHLDEATLPNTWNLVNYRSVKGGGEYSVDKGLGGSGCLTLTGRTKIKQRRYRNRTAANADFHIFHCETLADNMDRFIRTIKQTDPGRPVGTYLAYAWAMGNMWGYNYNARALLDVELLHAWSADAIGMQLAGSLGDSAFATFAIDTARKYGKPMWATDLQDFSVGVAAGPQKISRLAQACIQHGLDEIYWYDWFGTENFDFYPGSTGPNDPRGRGAIPMEELRRINTLAVESIERTAGMELRSPIALISPMVPYHNGMPDARGNDPAECFGWYYLLLRAGTIPDIITLYEIKRAKWDLYKHKAAIVPDAFFDSEYPADCLRLYAAPTTRDRKVILSGRTAPYRGVLRGNAVFFDDHFIGRDLLGPQRRVPSASNTPAMLTPERIRWERLSEKGPVREAYRLIREILSTEPARLLKSTNFVTLATYQDPEDATMLLHLVNHDDSHAEDVRIELAPEFREARITTWCDGQERRAVVTSGKVNVPRFETVCQLEVRGSAKRGPG